MYYTDGDTLSADRPQELEALVADLKTYFKKQGDTTWQPTYSDFPLNGTLEVTKETLIAAYVCGYKPLYKPGEKALTLRAEKYYGARVLSRPEIHAKALEEHDERTDEAVRKAKAKEHTDAAKLHKEAADKLLQEINTGYTYQDFYDIDVVFDPTAQKKVYVKDGVVVGVAQLGKDDKNVLMHGGKYVQLDIENYGDGPMPSEEEVKKKMEGKQKPQKVGGDGSEQDPSTFEVDEGTGEVIQEEEREGGNMDADAIRRHLNGGD